MKWLLLTLSLALAGCASTTKLNEFTFPDGSKATYIYTKVTQVPTPATLINGTQSYHVVDAWLTPPTGKGVTTLAKSNATTLPPPTQAKTDSATGVVGTASKLLVVAP